MGFFSEERKGDIIARMSGDVQEVENSIMSSLDMLFKNPILIVAYFTALVVISWQLTIFTILFVPGFGWFMGFVGRKLKAQSTEAQSLWSDTMSMVEETLGGLRIIKAFCAESKMNAYCGLEVFSFSTTDASTVLPSSSISSCSTASSIH